MIVSKVTHNHFITQKLYDQYVFSLRINPSAFLSAELQKTLTEH